MTVQRCPKFLCVLCTIKLKTDQNQVVNCKVAFSHLREGPAEGVGVDVQSPPPEQPSYDSTNPRTPLVIWGIWLFPD
jgi:hypothetical protein